MVWMIGIKADETRTSAEGQQFTPGTIGWNMTSAGPKGYVYVKDSGSGITAAGYVAVMDGSDFTAVMASTTTTAPGAGQGKLTGVALDTIPANGFGWLQIFGAGSVRVAASCAAYTNINSTGTAGQLDDDATAGAEVIEGIVLDAANGVSAGNAACWINWPRAGRTL